MIEKTVLNQLNVQAAPLKAYMEEPESPPGSYILLEKTGGSQLNQIKNATFAVQCYGTTLLEAATLADAVNNYMLALPTEVPSISRCFVNAGPYNFTDEETHRYRYQGVYNLVYKE